MKKKIIMMVLAAMFVTAGFAQISVGRMISREERLNETYCSGLFNTADGVYFDMLNDPSATGAVGYRNILDWLEGRVAGLQVYVTRTNVRIPFLRNNLAGVYVDEIWHDPDYLNLLSISDIAMIKVIKGPFLGGFNSPGGAIAIYTVGDEEEETID